MRDSMLFKCLAIALFLSGCALDDSALSSTQGDMGSSDTGVVCPDDLIPWQGRCVEPPPDPADRGAFCVYTESLTTGCPDLDGDCTFANCPKLPDALAVAQDCDDHRPEAYPGAAELCNGLDDDCDIRQDEDFDRGKPCMACGRDGKTECHFDDPTQIACSVEFGQSKAPEADEICNEIDDDCDGVVDEDCALPEPTNPLSEPAICGDRVVVIEDGLVMAYPLNGDAPSALSEMGTATLPSCDGPVTAWLDMTDAAASCDPVMDQPRHCRRSHLMIRDIDGNIRDVTGLGNLGAPVVTQGTIYWHSLFEGSLKLEEIKADGSARAETFEFGAFSDPTRPTSGVIAVLDWQGDHPRARLKSLDGRPDPALSQPNTAAGPPAYAGGWWLWRIVEGTPAIWAVSPAGMGFQLTAGGQPEDPLTDGRHAAWRDTGELWLFDLITGAKQRIASDISGYDLRDGLLVWIDSAGQLRQRRL